MKNGLRLILGTTALILSLLSFILGSAPFTPALILVFIAVPLAALSAALGSWRLAILTLYYSTAAWFSIPISKALSFRVDYLLLGLFIFGVAFGAYLYIGYNRTTHTPK
ncbi:hypothetical protein [uncultured Microbulbifer sp.]|uniref:hypothetical protein n=1 Tax=uncultured Microbulbifer sp. TaxID=348147 RepID=UPI002607CD46|nr:hypothetical protein [uncultured Microbulbifer sp.]